jgi:hypothetical protein
VAWTTLPGQMVHAEVSPGRHETVLAVDFETSTKAILVAWPPHGVTVVAGQVSPDYAKTEVAFGHYDPCDADAWSWATGATHSSHEPTPPPIGFSGPRTRGRR